MSLLARIRASRHKLEPIPPHFLTANAWAKKWGGLHPSAARRLLADGVEQGLVTVKTFRVVMRDGRVHLTPHYAEKK